MRRPINSPMKGRNSLEDFSKLIGLNPDTFKLELRHLLRIKFKPRAMFKLHMFLIGIVLLPLTPIGIMIGYARAYRRFMYPNDELPRLKNLPFIVRFSMALGVVVVWTLFIITLLLLRCIVGSDLLSAKYAIIYCTVNILLTLGAYGIFRKWRVSMHNLIFSYNQHGSAREANAEELKPFTDRPGLYIGDGMTFADKGHVCTIGGSRGGKGANLLTYAALGEGGYSGSMFIIDPKGEIAATTSRYMRGQGKNLVLLNAWDLLPDHISDSSTYNPLDFLSDPHSPQFIDDIGVVAELLLPPKPGDHNSFFTDSARAILAALLLHLMCSDKYQSPTLMDLWRMVRTNGQAWDELLADMAVSTHPVNGEAIRQSAYEILKQMASPETFSSIISNALEATNFLKSNALQKSLVSGFDPYQLADGNTIVYLIVPADLLKSQGAYMRLVTVSLMRAVVRKPNEPVTCIVDETAFLGNVTEFPTALATYAGYNLRLWLVFQSLPQIKAIYGDIWEDMVANTAVRHFFSVKDNMTCKYVSEAIGNTTDTVFKRDWMGNITEVENTKRELFTPDEVRIESKKQMFIFTGENHVIRVPKNPYYLNPNLIVNGKPIYDPNPYIENSK